MVDGELLMKGRNQKERKGPGTSHSHRRHSSSLQIKPVSTSPFSEFFNPSTCDVVNSLVFQLLLNDATSIEKAVNLQALEGSN